MTDIFALFADATSSPIVLGFLEPEDVPLKPIPLNVDDKQVLASAANGFYAAYQVLKGLDYIRGDKFCFSYQFKADDLTFYAMGESAGLAFCLKFAQEIWLRKTGEKPPYSIAATGVISDGTENAEIRRVSGIRAKLEAAMACLQKGDRVFYPAENEAEIGPELKTEATEKGIELLPVATVAQALQNLLGQFPRQEYPIKIEGLGQLVASQDTYQVSRRVYLSRNVRIPFKIINAGNVDIEVEASGQEAGTDWLKLTLPAKTLRHQEGQEGSIDILPDNRLLCAFRHFLTFFFHKDAQITLCFHIPGEESHDIARNIRIRTHFINSWPITLILFVLMGSLLGYRHLSHWVSSPSQVTTTLLPLTPAPPPTTPILPPATPRPSLGESLERIVALMRQFFPQGGDFKLEVRPDKGVDAIYAEGERVLLHVLAETSAYLQVDYYQSDGKVIHLLPNLLDNNFVEGGKTSIIGKPGSSYQFTITAPFGEDLFTVIASQKPLEDQSSQSRAEMIEPAATYIDRLTSILQKRKAGGKIAGTHVVIRTKKP